MHQINKPNVTLSIPTPSAVGTSGWFRKANKLTEVRGTVATTDFLNAVMGELKHFIEAAGIVLDKTSQTQLIAAVSAWSEFAGMISDVADTGSVSTAHQRVVVGSSNSTASGPRAVVVASSFGVATGSCSFCGGVGGCTAGGTYTAIIGSLSSTVYGTNSAIAGSNSCSCVTGSSANRFIGGSDTCVIGATSDMAAILASDSCSCTGNINEFVAASAGCVVGGSRAAIIASFNDSTVDGSVAAALATDNAVVDGNVSAAIASESVFLGGDGSSTLASEGLTADGVDAQNNGLRCAMVACYGDPAGQAITALGVTEAVSLASYAPQMADGQRLAIVASDESLIADGTDCLIAASIDASIDTSGGQAAIVASQNVDITSDGVANAVMASINDGAGSPVISGTAAACAIIGCIGVVGVTGQGSAAMACRTGLGTGPVVSGDASAAIASDGQFDIQADNTMVVCSSAPAAAATISSTYANSMVFLSTGGGTTPSLYQTIRLEAGPGINPANHGDIYSDGVVGAGNADVAECFENAADGTLDVGSIVAHAEGDARLSRKGDRVLGVVSLKPAFLGNAAPLHWAGLIEQDDWGLPVLTYADHVRWKAIPAKQQRVFKRAIAWDPQEASDIEEEVPYVRWEATGELEAYQGRVADMSVDPPSDAFWYRVKGLVHYPAIAKYVGLLEDAPSLRPATVTKYVVELDPIEISVARKGYDGPEADAGPEEDWPADAEKYVHTANATAADVDLELHNSGSYEPRFMRRDEWTTVALLGQVRVRTDATVSPGDYIVPGDVAGQGTSSTTAGAGRPLEALKVLSPYDAGRGYAIVWCLVG